MSVAIDITSGKNTVLITGGSAGIGFELAKALTASGNHVIITGRNEGRLREAASQLSNVTAIVGDVSDVNDVSRLVEQVGQEHSGLNMVINNAGAAFVHDLAAGDPGYGGAFAIAQAEALTNYLSIVRLNEQLLPLLKSQHSAAIVNVSSIVAFAPSNAIPTYSASKAALHSYTRTLRYALRDTAVKVIELMPPLVNTDFSQEIGGSNGIPAAQVAHEFIRGLKQGDDEIHVGNTPQVYALSLVDPDAAFAVINSRHEAPRAVAA